MKYKLLSLLVALTISSNICLCANWKEIGNKGYIDIDSIKYQSDKINFWMKYLNTGYFKNIKGKKIWYELAYESIDCTNNTSAIIYFIDYGLNNKLIYENFDSSEFTPIAPDTNGETLKKIVCNLNLKSNKQDIKDIPFFITPKQQEVNYANDP